MRSQCCEQGSSCASQTKSLTASAATNAAAAFIKVVPTPTDRKQGGNVELEMFNATLVECEDEKINGHLKDLNQRAPQLR